MNKAPRTGLTHPLVVAYLGDLDRALSSTDAQERSDTLASVTEHLTEALGGDAEPTTDQVQAVLDELGSVERIAAASTPASAASSSTLEVNEPQRGEWAAPVLLGVSILSLFIPFVGALLAIGCLIAAIVRLKRETRRRGLLHATIAVSLVTLVITALLTVAALTLSLFSVTTESNIGPVVSSEAAVAPTTGP